MCILYFPLTDAKLTERGGWLPWEMRCQEGNLVLRSSTSASWGGVVLGPWGLPVETRDRAH